MQSVILRHLSSSDKDQECDISEAQLELQTEAGTTGVEVDAGQLGKVAIIIICINFIIVDASWKI